MFSINRLVQKTGAPVAVIESMTVSERVGLAVAIHKSTAVQYFPNGVFHCHEPGGPILMRIEAFRLLSSRYESYFGEKK